MIALNFSPEFAGPVERREKCQTIRQTRRAKVGDAIEAYTVATGGMSLRDWFAGQAMNAIIIGNRADICVHNLGAAKDAYIIADYMLAARALTPATSDIATNLEK
jgi:hypothetical protein